MRAKLLKSCLLVAVVAFSASLLTITEPARAQTAAPRLQGPRSIGPLTFGPDGILFAADPSGGAIFAFSLESSGTGKTAGAAGVEQLDNKLAAAVGWAPLEVSITDLAVHPVSRNAFVAVMRGRGDKATPALFRIDGAGLVEPVPLQTLKFSRIELPNAPAAPWAREDAITDMAFVRGQLWMSGLSADALSSKLRAIPYPFKSADAGASVEIFHGSHGEWETQAPAYTFLAHTINGEPHLLASYTCTPLVKFRMADLKPGAKVRGITVAELGNMNRPLDMILYRKEGKEFILISNDSRGVMKMPTDKLATAPALTSLVTRERDGLDYEAVASMRGVEQLDLLDPERSVSIARGVGGLALRVAPLP